MRLGYSLAWLSVECAAATDASALILVALSRAYWRVCRGSSMLPIEKKTDCVRMSVPAYNVSESVQLLSALDYIALWISLH